MKLASPAPRVALVLQYFQVRPTPFLGGHNLNKQIKSSRIGRFWRYGSSFHAIPLSEILTAPPCLGGHAPFSLTTPLVQPTHCTFFLMLQCLEHNYTNIILLYPYACHYNSIIPKKKTKKTVDIVYFIIIL